MRRRQLLRLGGTIALSAFAPRRVAAQPYPARPIRFIVPLPAGGAADIIARVMARWLERLGQPVIVENRPGAGTNVGVQAVVNAPPDGYTLLLIGTASAINASLYQNLAFDFLRDIAPVAGLVRFPLVMEVGRSLPVTTAAEFIAHARRNPGKVNMASSGIGTAPHLAGEMFKTMTGVEMVHVPYRGEPSAITDLIGGQVQVMFGNVSASIEQIRAGALRALGVTSAERSPALPDVPTIADTVPGYEASGWFGVGAPRSVPAEIIETLNREINMGLANAELRARVTQLGSTPMVFTAAVFAAHLVSETEKWGRVVRLAGVKAE